MNERKLTKSELAKREDIIMKMKDNKRALVQKYGKDAEAVMYGRATNLAKKQAEAMDQDRIKEMVKTALMGPMKEDQVEEGNAFIVAADAAKDAGKKEFEFPKGSGKMHPVTVKADIDEDLDLGHQDNEPHMLKGDLYRIGKYAMELYQMVDEFEGKGEVDFPHWWQSKIIKSKDMLVSAKHYLDFEVNEPQIDAMVDVAQDTEAIDEFDDKSMKAYGDAVKKAYGVKDKKDSLASLLDKYDLDMGWYKKHLLGIDELTPAELKDLEYVEDRIKAHLSNEGKLNEGTWSLGSINDIKAAIQTMEMGLDMDDTELEQHLQDNDAYFYNVLGDDELHDPLSRAYDLAAMGNEDRAHNELSDAIGRAYDLLAFAEKREGVKEGLPKGYWDKKMDAKDEVSEDYDALVNKIKKQGKSEKAAKAIAGAVASYKAKGGGKGPTAKQKG